MDDFNLKILADVINEHWMDMSKKEEMENILGTLMLVGSDPSNSMEGRRFLEALANLLRTLNENLE